MKFNSLKIFDKLILTVLLTVVTATSWGQTKASLSQYFQMPFMFNPGLAGIEQYTDIKTGYRRQWNDFSKAPKSFFLGANHRLGTAKAEGDVEKPAMAHGLSAYLFREDIAMYQQFQAGLSYAVHVPLTSTWKLSSGIGFAYNQFKTHSEDWVIRDYQDGVYQSLQASDGRLNYGSLDWGLVLYSRNLSAGYTVEGLINERMGDNFGAEAKLVARHKAFVSYNHQLTSEVELISSVLFQYESPLDPLYSVNVKARYKSFVWAGMVYSPDKAMSMQLGVQSIKNFNFGYSYDLSVGDANNIGSGNHELIIGYTLFNKHGKPSFLW